MQKMQYEKTCSKFLLLNGIGEIKDTGTYNIFIRHGDRDKIPDGEFGNEVELNSLGKYRSVEYGIEISNMRINTIYTSPIKRCVQTAENIVQGLGRRIPIELTTLLGDPGAFVYDGKLAGEKYMELGFEICYNSLLNHVPVEGNRDIAEGAALLNDFFNRAAVKDGVNIFISHDMIVALYAFETFGQKYTLGENWVKYLGGLILKNNGK